jgi:hypothetical protein
LRLGGDRRGERTGQRGHQEAAAVHAETIGRVNRWRQVRRARPPAAVRVTTPRLSRVQKANVEPLTELNAFFTEHQRCGDLDAGVDERIAWIACDCGAGMARRVDEDDALVSDG